MSRTMDYKFFLRQTALIILSPVKVLESAKRGDHSIIKLRNNLLFPLLVLVAICSFLGSWLFANPTLHPAYWVLAGIKYFLLDLAVVYLSSFLFSAIGKAMDLPADFAFSFSTVTYSLIPLFICQMLSLIFESLAFINILSLYGLWIIWLAGEILLEAPAYKKKALLVASLVVIAELYIGCSLALASIIERIYFAFFAW